MEASLVVTLTIFVVLGALVIGTVVGWIAHEASELYFRANQPEVQMHPEMYNDEGILIKEDLYSVRFTPDMFPDDDDEFED